MNSAALNLSVVLVTAALWASPQSSAADAPPTFGEEKTRWHGFDRYDFLMDEADLSIKPYKAPQDEGNAVGTPVKGQCGFHIVTGPAPTDADGPVLEQWNAVYKYLTDHGLSKKPAMEGAGGAAGEVYAWAIENPGKVACVYAENPILRSHMTKAQPLDRLDVLAKAGVPLLHVCGSRDLWLDAQTRVLEKRYKELGGQVTVIVQEGAGHFPTAPKDPKPVVEFIASRAVVLTP